MSKLFDIPNHDCLYQDAVVQALSDRDIQNFIADELYDPWRDTPLKGYKFLSSPAQGVVGQKIVCRALRLKGHDVSPRQHSSHDAIIDGYKTEVKFSAATYSKNERKLIPNSHILNHVSLCKDWMRLVFLGWNPEGYAHTFCWFTKKDFEETLRNLYFSTQQGGKNGGNDDHMCSSKKLRTLVKSPLVKDMTEWHH